MKIVAKGKLLRTIREYEKELSKLETVFYKQVAQLEINMQKVTGIEDIEFFKVDGDYVGAGTPMKPKKMKLIHRKYY